MAQYIPKDAVVAEIDRRLEAIANASNENNRELAALQGAQQYELINLIQFINTLEGKEVDLEKEIDKWWWGRTWQTYGMMLNSCNIRDFAKHFFELGLKAQKGE